MTGEGAPLVIVGAGEFAEIAYEYFTFDSPYEVVAFAVERAYIEADTLYDLPVVPLEDLPTSHPPEKFRAFVAVTSTHLNRVRARLYREVKERGYTLPSYISSRAFVWRNVEIGDNCFIFENNVLQHHVKVGNNVVLWSGNHVGHRTTIADHCFVTSHVVISGYCEVGESAFLGVNSCIHDFRKIGKDCVVGAGTVVIRDTEPGKVYVGNPAKAVPHSSYDSFNVPEDQR